MISLTLKFTTGDNTAMSARHLNYKEFLRSIYHESDQVRPAQYVPKAPDKKKATL